MNIENFKAGLELMEIEYEKTVKDKRRHFLFTQLQGCTDKDWRAAVQMILDDGTRRTFPRIGEIKMALGKVIGKRLDYERGQELNRDLRGIEKLMSGKGKTEAKKKLQELIQAVINKTKMDKLLDQMDPNPPMNSRNCVCNEDGLVFYKVEAMGNRYSHVGNCCRCRIGPRAYPLVDPVSGELFKGRA